MELDTASILVQLLLIFVLVAVFAGQRHLKARRERRRQPPGGTALPAMTAPVQTGLPPNGPRVLRAQPVVSLRVSEELLPPCFADTCADWAQVERATGHAPITRFSLADWSAPTDRVALEEVPALRELEWASDAPVPPRRTPRTASERQVTSAMSCTIAPQAYPFA